MRRHEFIGLLGSATAWPLSTRAQQADRMRRVGVIFARPAGEEAGARLATFREVLEKLGWNDGRNVRLEVRWSGTKVNDIRRDIAELLALAPDVILATGSSIMEHLHQATRTVPIVFAVVADPVGSGYVDTLAHPGRQCYRFFADGIWPRGKMARATKGDCTRCRARGCASRFYIRQYRRIRGNPMCGFINRDPGEFGKRARSRGDRAGHKGVVA